MVFHSHRGQPSVEKAMGSRRSRVAAERRVGAERLVARDIRKVRRDVFMRLSQPRTLPEAGPSSLLQDLFTVVGTRNRRYDQISSASCSRPALCAWINERTCCTSGVAVCRNAFKTAWL